MLQRPFIQFAGDQPVYAFLEELKELVWPGGACLSVEKILQRRNVGILKVLSESQSGFGVNKSLLAPSS